MTVQFIDNYLEKKMIENENYIECTYYDLRINNKLSKEEVDIFLELSKIKLENSGYKVYFSGDRFVYQNANRKVECNQEMIAIKEETGKGEKKK